MVVALARDGSGAAKLTEGDVANKQASTENLMPCNRAVKLLDFM
jgi:hypothetical protein